MFLFIINLLSNQIPFKPLVSNLQQNLIHIFLPRNHQQDFSPNLITLLEFIHSIFAAPLGYLPPNPYSTVRNIHLIFVSFLGRDFQYKSPAPLNHDVVWFSSFNRNFQNLLTGICDVLSLPIKSGAIRICRCILVFLYIFVNLTLIPVVHIFLSLCPILPKPNNTILSILDLKAKFAWI